jgi:ADP-ribose pyrophosphatase YjhB (NUDIX family)
MSKRRFPIEEFHEIYDRVPRLTVEIIARAAGGIILTKRAIEPCVGMWHIPGGTVWKGERMSSAVNRVAQDELGLTVEPTRLLGIIEYPKLAAEGYRGWPVGVVYDTRTIAGEPRGSYQGELLGFFNEIPTDIIPDQADFLRQHQEIFRA